MLTVAQCVADFLFRSQSGVELRVEALYCFFVCHAILAASCRCLSSSFSIVAPSEPVPVDLMSPEICREPSVAELA